MIFLKEKMTRKWWSEAMPLMELHYKEIAVYKDFPISPDYEVYDLLQAKDAIRCYSVRDKNDLIGYSIYIISPNLHYKELIVAKNDLIFIHPERRGIGQQLIQYCDDDLKLEGVHVVTHHIKPHFDWSPILKRKKYIEFETIWAKRLDEEG